MRNRVGHRRARASPRRAVGVGGDEPSATLGELGRVSRDNFIELLTRVPLLLRDADVCAVVEFVTALLYSCAVFTMYIVRYNVHGLR